MRLKNQSYHDEKTNQMYFFSKIQFQMGMEKYLELHTKFTENSFYEQLGEYFKNNGRSKKGRSFNNNNSRFKNWGIYFSSKTYPQRLEDAKCVAEFFYSNNIDVNVLIPIDTEDEASKLMDAEKQYAYLLKQCQNIINENDNNYGSLVKKIESIINNIDLNQDGIYKQINTVNKDISKKLTENTDLLTSQSRYFENYIGKCFDNVKNNINKKFDECKRLNVNIKDSININNDDLKKEIKDIVKNTNIYRAGIILCILAFFMIILALKVNPFVYGLGCFACLTWSVKLISIAKKVVLGKWWNIAFNICASTYSILFAVFLIGPDVIRIILM